MLQFVAGKLQSLREEVVFLGGCTTTIFITDKTTIVHAEQYKFTDQFSIKVTAAPYFLATKLEAFKGRGKKDYYASHDLEDILSVLDGRLEIVEEIRKSNSMLRHYLSQSFSEMIKDRSFHDALPGHFAPYGNLFEDRIEILLKKLDIITGSVKE